MRCLQNGGKLCLSFWVSSSSSLSRWFSAVFPCQTDISSKRVDDHVEFSINLFYSMLRVVGEIGFCSTEMLLRWTVFIGTRSIQTGTRIETERSDGQRPGKLCVFLRHRVLPDCRQLSVDVNCSQQYH